MLEFTDEFGARVWILVQSIKYFKENVGGPYASMHSKAKSVIETSFGDTFYVKESCEVICGKLFGNKTTVE